MITWRDIFLYVTEHWRVLIMIVPLIIAVAVVRILR